LIAFDYQKWFVFSEQRCGRRDRETYLGKGARAVRDGQCRLFGDGVYDPVVRELGSIRAVGGQGRDNNRGVGAVPGSQSTSGRSQQGKTVLHVENEIKIKECGQSG